MTYLAIISAAGLLADLLPVRLETLFASAGPRADALLLFILGSLLVAGSSVVQTLVNLVRRRRLLVASSKSPFPSPKAKTSSARQSTTDVA